MLSLPSLAPQDSYTLWYTSSTSNNQPQAVESNNSPDHFTSPTHGQNAGLHSNRRQNALHRTPLARLRLDEEYMERRKQNISNYGNSWIKPPGVPKSLYQLREEKREMEEHQEALRREALAQELADAEAEGADEFLQGDGMDGDVEEARDLDDDVPEAETTALDADDSDDEDHENDFEEVPRNVLASRLPDDAYREAIVRGEAVGAPGFGDEGGSTIDEEDQSGMLQEEDLIHDIGDGQHDLDMDMDADLDADIPEAEEGGYEHTDTEAELTSSDDESVDAGLLPQRHTVTTSMVRSDGTQNSMDLSSIISGASSQLGSSPQLRSDARSRRGAR